MTIEPKRLGEGDLNLERAWCRRFGHTETGRPRKELLQHIAALEQENAEAIKTLGQCQIDLSESEQELTTALAAIGVMREAFRNLKYHLRYLMCHCGESGPCLKHQLYNMIDKALTQSPPEAMELVRDKDWLLSEAAAIWLRAMFVLNRPIDSTAIDRDGEREKGMKPLSKSILVGITVFFLMGFLLLAIPWLDRLYMHYLKWVHNVLPLP